MQQLAEIGLTPDEWDGDIMVIPVSAKLEEGLDDLLEAILLTAEELEPRANPAASPSGTSLEARIEKGRGVMSTLLIQNGTLKVGNTLLAGNFYGRIKAMYDYNGRPVKIATPSSPVSVSGLNGIPEAGIQFKVVESEKVARRLVELSNLDSAVVEDRRAPVSLDDFFVRLQEGETKSLNLIIKADVQGSLEPIVNSVSQLSGEEVTIDVLRAATGNISENDILLASASDAVVLGFNVDIDPVARVAASNEQVEINTYSIIYKLIEDIDKALKGMLAPVFSEVIIGRAEVRQTFVIRSVGTIAGCYMRTGVARRNSQIRVVRNSELLHSGKVSTLKHLTENVREVKAGFEFGVSLEGWNNIEPGDILEFFVVERTLA